MLGHAFCQGFVEEVDASVDTYIVEVSNRKFKKKVKQIAFIIYKILNTVKKFIIYFYIVPFYKIKVSTIN